MNDNIQLNSEGKLKHFLSIDGLPKSLLTEILDVAESFVGVNDLQIKKVPLLRGKTIVNLFFENSTRTRTTFELAAKRLSADVLSMSIATSSTSKGESLLDTIRNLEAMFVDMFVVRHAISGAAHFIAQQTAPHISVINAGDGQHAHPTQAMLDMFTIRQIKKDFSPLKVAIIGDILHSRVARSQIQALNTLGVEEVRVIAPKTLLPAHVESMGVNVFHNLNAVSKSQFGFAMVCSNGYRLTITMSIGLMPLLNMISSSMPRRPKIPPWTLGCKVLTRPSIISGNPV